MSHLKAFAKAADEHGGSRAVLTGYNASAEYVEKQLLAADFFDVQRQYFLTAIYEEIAPPVLEVLGADPHIALDRCEQTTGWQHYYIGCDFAGVRYGGNGTHDVSANVEFVEDACADAGWAAFSPGNIALVEASSACDYYVRGLRAEGAKAAALVFMSTAGANGYPGSRVFDSSIPVEVQRIVQTPAVGVTHAIGQLLKQRGTRVRVATHTAVRVVPSFNVIAETRLGDPSAAVMMGSHLDSVPEGPGLNDNGSGSASNLEIALEWAARAKARAQRGDDGHREHPRVRFAWWGSEETGLIGSRHYVDELVARPGELEKVLCYLNYDMEAGPNYVRMVHDASTAPVASTIPASEVIQRLYEGAWRQENLSYAFTPMAGGSDFLPFNLAGIPTGGMATGASGIKSEAERAVHGGLANTQLDPCYHAPCDTLDNINEQCLFETARVAATVLERIVHSHRVKDSPFRQPLAGAAARRAEYKELLQQAHIKKRFSYACNENPEGED